MNDPVIENKEEVIDEFLTGVIMLENDREKKKFLSKTFSVKIDREDDEDNGAIDEASDVSLDGSLGNLYAEIKKEML